MASMKYVWKIMARDGSGEQSHPSYYAYAASMREALELAGLPNALAIPQTGKDWPNSDTVHLVLAEN